MKITLSDLVSPSKSDADPIQVMPIVRATFEDMYFDWEVIDE